MIVSVHIRSIKYLDPPIVMWTTKIAEKGYFFAWFGKIQQKSGLDYQKHE